MLRATLARRLAVLQDFDGFEDMWNSISATEHRVSALFAVLAHTPVAELPHWFSLAWQLDPRFHARARAWLWSLATQRTAELTRTDAVDLARCWLTTNAYGQPWELLADLVGLGPVLAVATDGDVRGELRELLDSALQPETDQ